MSKSKKNAPHQEAPSAPEFVWTTRHTRIALGMILAATVAVGVTAVIQFMQSPFYNLPIIDEEAYIKWALEIARGEVVGKRIFYQDPLYPYFLSLLFEFIHVPTPGEPSPAWTVIRLSQVVMGTLSVLLVYLTGRRLWGEKTGLVAAAFIALYRGLYFFELQMVKASMVLLLSALSCLLGVVAAGRPEQRRWFFLTGFVLGLLTLLRGNFLLLLPVMTVWAFWVAEAPLSRRLITAGALALGIGLVLMPVSVRNYVVGGEFVLTTSQGGANFYLGNNERANGRYATLPFVRANPQWEASDFQKEAERRAGRSLSPSEVSHFWFHEAFTWIEDHPRRAALLTLHKARLMIHQYEIPDNHSFYLTRDEFVAVLWLPILGFGLLWAPAALGIWLDRRERRAAYPAVFAVIYCLSIIPFFIVDRYRVAVVPAMALFAAWFVKWAARQHRAGRKGTMALVGMALLMGWLLGFWPTTESSAPMGMEYYLLANAYLKTGDPAASVPWYKKAREALPNNQDVQRNLAEAMRRLNQPTLQSIMEEASRPETSAERLVELGRELEGLGQIKAAVTVYERAAVKDPNLFPPRARLGLLYATNPEVNNPPRSLMHLHQALKIRPGDLDTMNALGNASFLAGDTVEARHWWEEVLKQRPDMAEARRNLETLKNFKGPPPGAGR